jgi:hypothetical protein
MSFKISRKEWEGCCNLVTAKLIFMWEISIALTLLMLYINGAATRD